MEVPNLLHINISSMDRKRNEVNNSRSPQTESGRFSVVLSRERKMSQATRGGDTGVPDDILIASC
jgi:hypothetical protein